MKITNIRGKEDSFTLTADVTGWSVNAELERVGMIAVDDFKVWWRMSGGVPAIVEVNHITEEFENKFDYTVIDEEIIPKITLYNRGGAIVTYVGSKPVYIMHEGGYAARMVNAAIDAYLGVLVHAESEIHKLGVISNVSFDKDTGEVTGWEASNFNWDKLTETQKTFLRDIENVKCEHEVITGTLFDKEEALKEFAPVLLHGLGEVPSAYAYGVVERITNLDTKHSKEDLEEIKKHVDLLLERYED